MICTIHQILFELSNEEELMGGACSTCDREERCMQSFGRKS